MKKLITFMANLTLILALTLSLAVSAFALTPADSAETSVITYSDEQLLNPLAGELPQNSPHRRSVPPGVQLCRPGTTSPLSLSPTPIPTRAIIRHLSQTSCPRL